MEQNPKSSLRPTRPCTTCAITSLPSPPPVSPHPAPGVAGKFPPLGFCSCCFCCLVPIFPRYPWGSLPYLLKFLIFHHHLSLPSYTVFLFITFLADFPIRKAVIWGLAHSRCSLCLLNEQAGGWMGSSCCQHLHARHGTHRLCVRCECRPPPQSVWPH